MAHGHVAPNLDGSKARCGGPGLCPECAHEAFVAQIAKPVNPTRQHAPNCPKLSGGACNCPATPLQPTDPILQFFGYTHLPPAMQEVSRPFGELAAGIVERLPRNPERSVALRKLLEAKDAAVRSTIFKAE